MPVTRRIADLEANEVIPIDEALLDAPKPRISERIRKRLRRAASSNDKELFDLTSDTDLL